MLTFSPKGFLEPDKSIETTLESFRQTFVEDMPNAQRRAIFENFEQFCHALMEGLDLESLLVWLNGSFATRKEEPGDLDFVVFLDVAIKRKNEQWLAERFPIDHIRTSQKLDFYFVEVFPIGHRDFRLNRLEDAYWTNQFSRTKPNRQGIMVKKGFLAIKITKNEIEKTQPLPD